MTPLKELASFVWSPRGTLGGLTRKSSWGRCHAVNSLHSPSRRKAGRQCPSEGKAKHNQEEIGFLQEIWGKQVHVNSKNFFETLLPLVHRKVMLIYNLILEMILLFPCELSKITVQSNGKAKKN